MFAASLRLGRLSFNTPSSYFATDAEIFLLHTAYFGSHLIVLVGLADVDADLARG